MGADVGELRAWARDLGEAAEDLIPEARKVLVRGVINIKRDAKRRISGHPSFRRLPAAITDDVRQGADLVEVEVGPEHGRPQGNMGHILENGTPTSAPSPYMRPATDRELPAINRYLDSLIPELLE